MERLTSKRDWIEAGKDLSNEYGYSHIWRRLKQIEDILGDTYDLDRLRKLAEADKDGRCAVLPVKPGEAVRFAKNPRAKHEKVACVTLYEGGKIYLGFHDVGYKETWVDEWSEDDAENYVLAAKEVDHERTKAADR